MMMFADTFVSLLVIIFKVWIGSSLLAPFLFSTGSDGLSKLQLYLRTGFYKLNALEISVSLF